MRSRASQEAAVSCLQVRWLGWYLPLLVAACAPAPAVSSVTPTAGSIMRAAPVSMHGHLESRHVLADVIVMEEV